MARNYTIVDSFLQGHRQAGNLSTDGQRIWSYNVVIAEWSKNNREVVMVGSSRFYSVTTSRHRAMVRRAALNRGIPVIECG